MHPIETSLMALLEAGEEPSITKLGGLEAIASAVRSLSASPLMPEVLRPVLRFWDKASTQDRTLTASIVQNLIEGASTDFVLIEAVDILDSFRPLPDGADEVYFAIFLAKAGQSAGDLSGLARSAALDGAFRWATSNRRWQFRLLDFLLGLSSTEEALFLRHAAKITGVAYSHWRERELLLKLAELAALEVALPEASFELGMANLADGLDASSRDSAQEFLRKAKDWFDHSASSCESNPEARLYGDCLGLLTQYGAGRGKEDLTETRDRVWANAFELTAWRRNENAASWLGSRHAEAACWSQMANTIAGLVEHLDETAWWDPSAVIEQHILASYTASRSILRRRENGTLEMFVRPRIAASLARAEGQAYLLKTWLTKNAAHEWANEARQLITDVDRLVEREKGPQNPSEAAASGLTVAALIDRAGLPPTVTRNLVSVVWNAFALQLDNLTCAEVDIIEKCRGAVAVHPDHRDNPHGQRLFDTALLWTVRFVYTRLEVTQKDDRTVAYLFERADGELVHEDELQADYFRWLSTNAAGTDLEPTNLGGGRGDLKLKSSGERIVIEVKREMSDSSFDAIADSFAAQSTDYQNVSIRLGFLLVLDLVASRPEGTPHISTLFETRDIRRTGEFVPRSITIVKVPGRRMRPSDLTKAAKSKRTR
jgi:hypothetical protein